MPERLKQIGPVGVGLIVAVVLYFVPEAKPIACGGAIALPALIGGT